MARAGSLLRYSATRLGLAPVMLWLIATLVFFCELPLVAVDAVLGSRAPAAAGSDARPPRPRPIAADQYLNYLHGCSTTLDKG